MRNYEGQPPDMIVHFQNPLKVDCNIARYCYPCQVSLILYHLALMLHLWMLVDAECYLSLNVDDQLLFQLNGFISIKLHSIR